MNNNLINFAKNVIDIEILALNYLKNNLDNNFIAAVNLIKNCKGKVIITGMGKSGHVGAKIAATLTSTGTPSFFLHSAEAGHGDLGIIDINDVLIYISYSGVSAEIETILPIIKRLGVKTIAITGNKNSDIVKESDIWLNVNVKNEACPHNLAPTSSTTATLVLGDALAMSLLEEKGFSAEDFARSHPSGALGKKLLTSVFDVMNRDLPVVATRDNLLQSLVLMTNKKLGILIATKENKIKGIFTDGDLRRVIENNNNISDLIIDDVINKKPQVIQENLPVVKALEIMEKFSINALPVVDDKDNLVGAINMQTLIQNKII